MLPYTTYLIDLDGVVYRGNDLLPGARQAAVQNIARRVHGGSVYVVGEQPLIDLVEAQGLTVVPVESAEADAVLVGLDRAFDYQKMANAANAIRAGALFVTINRD